MPSPTLSRMLFEHKRRSRPPVLRTFVMVMVAVALGVAATYLVAWNLQARATLAGVRAMPANILACPVGSWPEPAPLWPAPFVGRVSCTGFDSISWVARAKHTPNGLVPVVANTEVSRVWQEVTIGYPFRCARQRVRSENWHVPVPAGHIPAASLDDGVALASIVGLGPFTVPWRPVWPGLLANAAIYAGILCVILEAVRRMFVRLAVGRRIANGQCGGCGYDRAGLGIGVACTECGVGGGEWLDRAEMGKATHATRPTVLVMKS